jgi:uncharacterized membrane protein
MMSRQMSGWAWWWMSLMMAAFWGAVAFAIYALARNSRPRDTSAGEILARRYARGEISRNEFEESRKLLAN